MFRLKRFEILESAVQLCRVWTTQRTYLQVKPFRTAAVDYQEAAIRIPARYLIQQGGVMFDDMVGLD